VNKRDADAAANCFRAIESEAIALHPQVVIERGKALAALGSETLDERGRWPNAVSALDDEWLAERRASWLIDCGNSQAAFDLLRSTHFQLVHQRYGAIVARPRQNLQGSACLAATGEPRTELK